ncbi:MAG: hypothetical protein JWP14_556 [Frankiales bacterium]|nr:hypothetical protein [Frankiales bacterium]
MGWLPSAGSPGPKVGPDLKRGEPHLAFCGSAKVNVARRLRGVSTRTLVRFGEQLGLPVGVGHGVLTGPAAPPRKHRNPYGAADKD